jgi:hypothetical protein
MGFVTLNVPCEHPQFGKSVLCPECRGGKSLEQHRQARREKTLRLLKEAGLTETDRHAWLTWEHFSPDALGPLYEGKAVAIELARAWARGEDLSYDIFGEDHPFALLFPTAFPFQPTQSLWLHGEPGTGKTGLAYLAYRIRRSMAGEDGIFIEWSALYEALKSQYGKTGDDNQVYPLLSAVANTPVLVLDDVGHLRRLSAVSDDQYDKLWQIVDQRYRLRLVTLITSNLDRDRLRDQFDSKLAGRLAEMCVIAHMDGLQFREFDR